MSVSWAQTVLMAVCLWHSHCGALQADDAGLLGWAILGGSLQTQIEVENAVRRKTSPQGRVSF